MIDTGEALAGNLGIQGDVLVTLSLALSRKD